jgi:site-specific recombinase XerD
MTLTGHASIGTLAHYDHVIAENIKGTLMPVIDRI